MRMRVFAGSLRGLEKWQDIRFGGISYGREKNGEKMTFWRSMFEKFLGFNHKKGLLYNQGLFQNPRRSSSPPVVLF
jgi:hypothetical protein